MTSTYGTDLYENPEVPGQPFTYPGTITPPEQEGGLFPGGFTGVATGVARGALRGLDEIGDLILPEDWFQVSDVRATGITGIMESISQFTVGFLIPGGAIGKAAQLGKLGGFLAGSGKLAKASVGMLKGAAADFTAFDGHEDRLSNMLTTMDSPVFNNQVTQFLASDEQDSELLGRMKNTIEGMGLGVAAEGILAGIKHMWKIKKVPGRAEAIKEVREWGAALEEAAAGDMDRAPNLHPVLDENSLPDITPEQMSTMKPPLLAVDDAEPELALGINVQVPGGVDWKPTNPKIPWGLKPFKQPKPINTIEEEAIAAVGVLNRSQEEIIRKIAGEAGGFIAEDGVWKFESGHIDLALRKRAKDLLNLEKLNPQDGPELGIKEVWAGLEDTVMNDFHAGVKRLLVVEPESVEHMMIEAADRVSEMTGMDFNNYMLVIRSHSDDMATMVSKVMAHRMMFVGAGEVAAKALQRALKEGGDESMMEAVSHLWRVLLIGGEIKGQAAFSGRLLRSYKETLENIAGSDTVGKMSKPMGDNKAEQFIGARTGLNKAVYAKDGFELMDAFGGLDTIREEAELAVRLFEEGGTDFFLKFIAEGKIPHNGTNLFGMVRQTWVGNLLSGPPTWVVNGVGTFANIHLRVAQRFVGGIGHAAVTGNTEGIAASYHTMMGMYEHIGQAMRNFSSSIKQNRGVLFPDSRIMDQRQGLSDWVKMMDKERLLAGKETTNAMSRELRGKFGQGSPWSPSGDYAPLERFFELGMSSTGFLTSLPGRILGSTDTMLKTMSFYGHARASLFRRGHALVSKGEIAPERLSQWVRERADRMVTTEGAYLSKANLRTQFEKEAREPEMALEGLAKERYIGNRMRETMNDPTVKQAELMPLASEAKAYAEEATWTNQFNPYTQRVAKSLQGFKNRHPWMTFITPFIQTPANIFSDARQHLDFTGPIRHMIAKFQDPKNITKAPSLKRFQTKFTQDIASGDPIKVSEAYGRMAFGVSTVAWMASLASTGQLTGRGPSDPEERNSLKMSGWQPYSFRIPRFSTLDNNPSYISYNRLDPFATVAGMVADMYHYAVYKDDTDTSDFETMLMAATTAVANQATQKTFMTGIRQAVGALDQPDKKMPVWFQQTVGALVVPTFLSNLNAPDTGLWSEDQSLREVRNVVDAITNRMPGMSQNLEPRRNILGEPVKKTKRLGKDSVMPGINLWMPVVYSEVSDDILDKELGKMAYGFTPPNRRKNGLNLLNYRSEAGQSAFDRWGELQGRVEIGGMTIREALHDVIGTARYQQLPESEIAGENTQRVDMLRRIMRRYRDRAFHAVLGEFPDYAQDYQNARMGRFQRRASLDHSQYDPRSSALAKIFPQ